MRARLAEVAVRCTNTTFGAQRQDNLTLRPEWRDRVEGEVEARAERAPGTVVFVHHRRVEVGVELSYEFNIGGVGWSKSRIEMLASVAKHGPSSVPLLEFDGYGGSGGRLCCSSIAGERQQHTIHVVFGERGHAVCDVDKLALAYSVDD